MKSWLFWVSCGIDALVGAIVFVFLFIGLADGSVNADNIGIWMGMMAAIAVIIGGGLWLKKAGRMVLGTLLLLVLAVPSFLSGLFLFWFVVSGTQWR